MNYKYFTLDKNPKQFKKLNLGEYTIELRIEWNTRSKAWYILGYVGNDLVISNTKVTPSNFYPIDVDSNYNLPYSIGLITEYANYDWDTKTILVVIENPLSNAVDGLTPNGGLINRYLGTSSDTHSRKSLKGGENKYLFDLVRVYKEDVPFGDWIVNQNINVVDGVIKYNARKTNGTETITSFANFDLITALSRSFKDEDMQQWQGFADAVYTANPEANSYKVDSSEELVRIGVVPEEVDIHAVAETLVNRWQNAKDKGYTEPFVGMAAFNGLMEGIGWVMDEGGKITSLSNDDKLSYPSVSSIPSYSKYYYSKTTGSAPYYVSPSIWDVGSFTCSTNICSGRNSKNQEVWFTRYENSSYSPTSSPPTVEVSDPLEIQIALQQALLNNNAMQAAMIAEAIKDAYSYDKSQEGDEVNNRLFNENSRSINFSTHAREMIKNRVSENEMLHLLADTYIRYVYSSVLLIDPTKQFVTIEDLIPQFEINQT